MNIPFLAKVEGNKHEKKKIKPIEENFLLQFAQKLLTVRGGETKRFPFNEYCR
jgi:hypothetical protein